MPAPHILDKSPRKNVKSPSKPSRLRPLERTSSAGHLKSIQTIDESLISPPAPLSDKRSLSLQLLTGGYINSFIDFFYLTHKKDDSAAAGAGSGTSGQNGGGGKGTKPTAKSKASDSNTQPLQESSTPAIPPLTADQLTLIADHLRTAEASHRIGSSQRIFDSYTQLSKLFSERREHKTAIYFSEKLLELASNIGAENESLECLSILGKLFDECGESEESITMYEKCSSMSPAHTHSLTMAYKAHAKKLFAQSQFESAITFYDKCRSKAHELSNSSVEMECHYSLGLCYSALGRMPESMESYQSGLSLAKQAHHSAMIADISFALANNYEMSGETNLALNYLELSVYHAGKVSNNSASNLSTTDLRRLLKGWNKMGELYSASGDHTEAAKMFEKTYELAKKHDDQSMMDRARINVGMARANVAMKAFMAMCQEKDLTNILEFKAKRKWPADTQLNFAV